MQSVLVLENNQKTAERLVAALKQIKNLSVSVVPTMREACLIVAQTPQALAFIPLTESQQLGQALRSFQRDLKLVLTTTDSQLILSNDYRQDFYGLLHLSQLEQELPDILSGIELVALPIQQPPTVQPLPPGLNRFDDACQEAGLGEQTAVKMVVLSSSGQIIGYFGETMKDHVQTVLAQLDESWPNEKYSACLQFLDLPDYYDARLVYSRQVFGAVLTLVALPDTPVGVVRETADKLAHALTWTGRTKIEAFSNRVRGNGNQRETVVAASQKTKFVIAWRPVKPLPLILQNVIWDCLSDLAIQNDCKLSYLSVKADIIQMVIACSAGKTAAWAAYVLKSGINEEIQRQFGVKSSIWRKGFYASESDLPLKEAELRMLLAS